MVQLRLTKAQEELVRSYDGQVKRWGNFESSFVRHCSDLFPDFVLRWYQRKIFALAQQYKRALVIASRQIGKTETLVRFAIVFATLIPGQLVLVTSGGDRQAKEFLTRVRKAIKLSKYHIPKITDNAREIELWNGSRILSLPNNSATTRGYPANLLLIDEVDSIWNFEDFCGALLPSVSGVGGSVIASGTFKGKTNLWQLFNGKNDKPENRWPSVVFPCWVHPSADIQQQIRDLRPSTFAQEFECKPIDEAGTMFPYDMWDDCESRDPRPINLRDKQPKENALYFGGWDVAELVDASPFITFEVAEKSKALLRGAEDYHGMRYSRQTSAIAEWHKHLRYRKICMDVTSVGRPPYEMLEDLIGSVVTPINFSTNKKIELASDFRIAIQDRNLILPRHIDSKHMEILRREAHDLNPQTLDHSPGGSSDYFWATCLAWHALQKNSFRIVSNAPTAENF